MREIIEDNEKDIEKPEVEDNEEDVEKPEVEDNEKGIEKNGQEETEKEIKFVPINDGEWDGEKGQSKWKPDSEKIPEKANPEGKSWEELKEEYDIDGIEFVNGEPDFSELARGEAHIQDFSEDRAKNFSQADQYEAERRGCSPHEVKEWRQENGYTWHERRDCETMDKVPSVIHNNIFHSGGISEKKKENNMEDFLN